MRRLAILSVLILVGTASAQDKAKDLLVGVWVAADTTKDKEDMLPTVEFKKDGVLIIKVGPISVDGKYKFLSDDEIQVDLELKGQKQSQKLKIAVTKDSLTTTDEKSKVEKFKRKS